MHGQRLFRKIVDNIGVKTYAESRRQLTEILQWLWDVAVGPILQELGHRENRGHDEPCPRVWWIGSGLLNTLPIHAAGYHDSTPPRSAIDRVVSSYSPTLKSLAHARERIMSDQMQEQKAVLIAMPETPEQSDLKFAGKEVSDLQKLLSPHIATTVIQNPTRHEVLSLLPENQIVHFSCHGHSATDPSQSSLFLNDWTTSPLTVSDLTSLHIRSPKFAYLSACFTSDTRDINLLDESINLSSAILLSGYPSVVGTLWKVTDEHASEVANDVYSWMLAGGNQLDVQRSAEGLSCAVRALKTRTSVDPRFRRKIPSDPFIWAGYIYVGG